jgi:hypothetical protein
VDIQPGQNSMYKLYRNNKLVTKQVFNEYEVARRMARYIIRNQFEGITFPESNPPINAFGFEIKKN